MTQTDGWEEVSYRQFTFPEEEAGKVFTGILVGKETGSFGDRQVQKYLAKSLEDDETYVILGSTILDDAMSRVSVGRTFQAVYEGVEKSSSGFPIKVFTVRVKPQ